MKFNAGFLIRGAALIGCAVMLFSYSARAQTKPEMIDDFYQPIMKGSRVTYDDLIDLVFPETGEATRKSVPLNNIFGDYRARVYEGNIQISHVYGDWVKHQGRLHFLLLISVRDGDGRGDQMFSWGEMNVLALFDVKGETRLIDAVDVQGDRSASFFSEQPILRIDPGTDAFLISNHHFNAGESFTDLTLIGVVKKRFKIILGDLPTLKIENGCGLNYEQKAFLTAVPDSAQKYREIKVEVEHIRSPDGAECARKVRGSRKKIRSRYAWDAQRSAYVKIKGR